MTTPVPRPRSGLLHIVDASGYSLAGARRLFRETAARLELIGMMVGLLLLWIKGSEASAFLIFIAFCGLVFMAEAINTAVEEVVDHVSPEWSEMARNAKDLGSFAVAASLLLAAGHLVIALCAS